jgi:Zn-dependent protease with chaperone function
MTLPYLFRLVCLCLGCFFVVHLAVGMAAGVCAPAAFRMAARRKPRAAARLLLAWRLLPAGVALVAVAGLCAPSYLWLEPRAASSEEMGLVFLAAACCGGAVWGISLARALAAAVRSSRYIRSSRQAGYRLRLAGNSIWVVDCEAPQLVLAGVFRPRMLVSRRVVDTLPPEQLEAALRHEQAHWTSRDNLKRLLLLLAPGLFPFSRALERTWAHQAEWAADDRAVAGDPGRSVSLAAALVAVARMGVSARPHALATSLLANGEDLSARIDRLLAAVPPAEEPAAAGTLWAACSALLAAGVALLIAQPAALYSVHSLLERLAH